MVGQVDIVAVDPPKYSMGYWVDEAFKGRGYATSAVRLAVDHAAGALIATDVYAGVTKGNPASVRVLLSNHFTLVEDMGDYERFHLPLDGGQPRSP